MELWSSNPQLYFDGSGVDDAADGKDCGRNSPRRLSLMRSPRTEEILKSVEQALHKTDRVFNISQNSIRNPIRIYADL